MEKWAETGHNPVSMGESEKEMSVKSNEKKPEYKVCAMYHFARLENFEEMRSEVLEVCQRNKAIGTILLAREGINGTIAAPGDGIENILSFLRSDSRLKGLDAKFSFSEEQPFYRMKVKLKKEIVTLGVPDIDPNEVVGEYVEPEDWNALISDPDVVVVDTRNDYEVEIGTFKKAINPKTATFREFPRYVEENMGGDKQKKVAMFCTGGIRCEKATALLKNQGFEKVYHLKGGILKYLEEVPKENSLWEGECFVFDNRVSVNHEMEPGQFDQCHACRHPISEEDKNHPAYKVGVSCPHCVEHQSDTNRKRAEARQLQIELSAERNECHIGQRRG